MRPITTALGTAVLGATLALTVPAAHAATPTTTSAACSASVAAANKAEAAYDAALADYNKQIKAGGHPGTAEQTNLSNLQNAANLATSDSVRVCRATGSPVGTMSTGSGSTSTGNGAQDITLGAALIAAVGVGAFALRRRNGANQA
ncbi:hypothetical protein [Streptacidiphilus cavernicola]|uniref:Gram-positive cocci surface proteins LPxTG domain-containing protein n=1 Tax=Streptacidiphilus cavernicola TaxID=3342716 RepID=A0ABV6VYI0_9ACTN